MIHAISFYLFASILLASAVMVIFSRNPVHSVMWLILGFFNAAGLVLLAGAEFIAMLLVIVYVGAVAVLFLFVVMMLNIDFAELRSGFAKYMPLGLVVALILAMEMIFAVASYQIGALDMLGGEIAASGAGSAGSADTTAMSRIAAPIATDASNIEQVGALLYSRYIVLFEAAGLILLVAMVGAILLTHRERGDVRGQNISAQIKRRSDEAVRLVQPPIGRGVDL